MNQSLSVLNTDIRIHDGLYSLNDLHRAAGGEGKHRPNRWLRSEQTQALIEEIENCPDLGSNGNSSDLRSKAVVTREGRNGGTYACKELVYAYAMWISPRFHLAVIRAFDALVTGQPPALPHLPSPLEDKTVIRAINRRAHELAEASEVAWRQRLTDMARNRLRRHPRTGSARLADWIAEQAPEQFPALPAPRPTNLLPEPQQQALLEQITPLMNLFHPMSQPFSNVLGVVRILRGQNPRTGTEEPAFRQLVPKQS